MRKVKLGNTGAEVSALCLGTLYMGSKEDQKTSYRILDQYSDIGGSFLDSANIYAFWMGDQFKGGESDSLVGRWMKARKNRDDMFITSKVGIAYPGQENGLTAQQIEYECDKSLRLMQTDYIDLYFAHADDDDTPQEEVMEAFHNLVKKGKVRNLGASNFRSWRLAKANEIANKNGFTPFCTVQQRHTYLRPKCSAEFGLQIVLSDDMIDYCANNDVAVMAYTATLNASYNTSVAREIPAEYHTKANDVRLTILNEVSEEVGATPLQVVLAWLMASKPAVIPLITGSTASQIAENIESLDVTLSDGLFEKLTNAGEYLM